MSLQFSSVEEDIEMAEQLLPMLAQASSYIPKKVDNNHSQHYFDYYYIVIIMSFVVVIR